MPSRCRGRDCTKRALHGLLGEKAMFCKNCKPSDEYKNVHSPKCKVCGITASYGKKGTKKREYCVTHKPDDYVDVVNPKCIVCGIIAYFGKKGTKKPELCFEHAPQDYVNVINPKCKLCDTQASFAKEGTKKPEYCVTHKPDYYVNVFAPICKTHLCGKQIRNPAYEGYCMTCFAVLFPDKPIKLNYRTKERALYELLKERFGDRFDIRYNERTECFNRFPDFKIDFGFIAIFIESSKQSIQL